MAKSQLEKFISNYISKSKKTEQKKGYADWLRKNGIDPLSKLTETLESSYAQTETANAKNSISSEMLSELGLSKSGYAKYLSALGNEKKISDTEGAISEYLKTDLANKSAYTKEQERIEAERAAEEKKAAEAQAKEEAKKEAERLKAEEKAKNEAQKAVEKLAQQAKKEEEANQKKADELNAKLYKDVKAAIEASKSTNYDDAYDYAIKKGLDEKTASELARSITDTMRESAVNKVISATVSRYMTENQAKEYALMLGLSEKDAELLGDFAFRLNQSPEHILSNPDYLDQLREQIKQNNK